MEIILNHIKESFPADELTVEELLKLKNFTFRLIITRVNGKLVRNEERSTTLIHPGDEVLVLHLISGG